MAISPFAWAIDAGKLFVSLSHLTRRDRTATWQYRSAVRMYLALLRRTELFTRKEIEELQQKRLKRVFAAAGKSSWWRAQFREAGIHPHRALLEELKKIPPQHKHVLAALPAEELITTQDRSLLLWRTTTGTSGIPITWAQDVRTHFLEYAAYYLRSLEHFSFPAAQHLGRKFFLMFNYPQVDRYYLTFFAKEVRLAYARFSAGADRPPPAAERRATYRAIRECRPAVLYGAPTALWFLAQMVEADGAEVIPDLIVVSGEMLGEDIRSYLERVFHCPVRSFYGTRELGTIAFDCSTGGNIFHLNSEQIILEVLDGNGQESADGVFGNLVMTSLGNTVMPLLRYRVGDLGRFVPQRCACGTALPRFELMGRESELLKLPDGRMSPIWTLYDALFAEGRFSKIRQYQIRQVALDRIVIAITPRQRWSDVDTANLRRAIRKCVGDWVNPEIVFEETIPTESHKYRTFVPLARQNPKQRSPQGEETGMGERGALSPMLRTSTPRA